MLPGAVDPFARYLIQYGPRSTTAAGGAQNFSVTLPKQTYSSITLDALFENLGASNFNFSLTVGGDAAGGWSQSATQQPIKLGSPELAPTFNAYLAARPEPWGTPISIPIHMTLSTTGDIFLTNLSATPGGDSDPALGSGDLAASSTSPVETDRVALTATVHNPGRLEARAVLVSFYTGSPSSGGVLLGSSFIPSISPGGSAQASLEWDTRGWTGPLTLYAVVDPGRQLAELNRENNTATLAVNVRSRPDLLVQSIAPQGPARKGLPVTVSVSVCNQGGSDAGVQMTGLYLGEPASGGVLLDQASSALAAGACQALNLAWTPAAPGPFTLFALADQGGAISEANKVNNQSFQAVYVGWGAPVYIDVGSPGDLAYAPGSGYGYLNAGTVVTSCGSAPEQTYRQGASGGAGGSGARKIFNIINIAGFKLVNQIRPMVICWHQYYDGHILVIREPARQVAGPVHPRAGRAGWRAGCARGVPSRGNLRDGRGRMQRSRAARARVVTSVDHAPRTGRRPRATPPPGWCGWARAPAPGSPCAGVAGDRSPDGGGLAVRMRRSCRNYFG